MSSFRQIEANRRNARLSTGPVTEDGRRKSQQNALRHGLTAETVIDALEDAEDYGHSKWPRPPTMTHNQLSRENSCSDWRASYGGCVALPPSRAACSRSRPPAAISTTETGSSEAPGDYRQRVPRTRSRMTTKPVAALLILAHQP
jgi:hypothetical protein